MFLVFAFLLFSALFFQNSVYSKENKLEFDIKKYAQDSLVINTDSNKIFLYGNANVTYEDKKIEASLIILSTLENTVIAISKKDSLGNIKEFAKYSDNNQSFEAELIKYNFKTKKSFAKNIMSAEGEGYIQGNKVKNVDNKNTFIKKGIYTTCDLRKPHFHIYSKKIKVIQNDKIICGPAILKFWNIPTPIVLPFGYFPNSSKESSGILLPSYGESENLGFFLKDLGYYFSINDYSDSY